MVTIDPNNLQNLVQRQIFADPSEGQINMRIMLGNVMIIFASDVTDKQKKELFDLTHVTALKFCAMWHHMDRYNKLEDELIRAAYENPIDQTQNQPVKIANAQNLFIELDGLLVQFKSTLDHMVHILHFSFGLPFDALTTFGDSGNKIKTQLTRNVPAKWKQPAQTLCKLIEENQPWLTQVIELTEVQGIAENTKPASPIATGRASRPRPTSAPSPVPSTRAPVVLKDGGSASYAIGPASSAAPPISHTTVAWPSSAHRMEGWRPLPELDRQRIESESRAVCLRHLAQLGYEARERDITNPGFDIEANRGGQRLLIEVKGHLGQAQAVTLTRTQWETFCLCRQSPDAATWELWNIENLGSEAGEIVVTRYRDIPVEALTPDDFTVDLSFCERAQPL